MEKRGIVPRKIKGFRDIGHAANDLRWHIVRAATGVYRQYGYKHWDTPALEYADCLGKYLPDSDTIEEGIYSFRNPELEPVLDAKGRELRDEWNRVQMEHHPLALRYDLTAPLARLYAERLWNLKKQKGGQIGKPPLFRRYQYGPVFRYEAKLDPGRYREFWQLDFDTVGVEDSTCDAEVCCVLSDALEAIGLERGSYTVQVNNRKLHRGLFEKVGVASDEALQRDILRVVDKFDKLGLSGVSAELSAGRVDPESGAAIPGLGLDAAVIDPILAFMESCSGLGTRAAVLGQLEAHIGDTPSGREGLAELVEIDAVLAGLGYGERRVVFEPTVARGLAYYTGPVFEVVSNLEYRDDKGNVRRFGSICGGGRYDGLVENLLGMRVPATGASIGVSRLAELLSRLQRHEQMMGPVLVVVMDRTRKLEYQRIASELRQAGIATEVYYGMQRRIKTQFSYADENDSPVAIIAGGNEFDRGTVSIKDLRLGKQLSQEIKSRAEWRQAQPAQVEVARSGMVAAVQQMLQAHGERA